jgi:hypothetical protein
MDDARYVTCRCQHCNAGIEFDANELSEENNSIACPHCGLETMLFIPNTAPNTVAANKSNSNVDDETWRRLQEIANSRTIFSNLDTLKLSGDTITIRKRGLANALASGMNGERTIQIHSLTAVQMKPAGFMSPGYILFSYAGSKPFMGGVWEATQDPDAFMFAKDLNGEIAELKAMVEQKMREGRQRAATAETTKTSLTDELRGLAELKQQGVLTPDEFEAAKKKLLSPKP